MAEFAVDWNQVKEDDCRNALRRCHAKLIDSLEWKDVLLGLYANGHISDQAKEEIEAKQTRSAACSNLLDKIKQRGKKVFVAFAEQLILTSQFHLHDLLKKEIGELSPGAFAHCSSSESARARQASSAANVCSHEYGGSTLPQSSSGNLQAAKPDVASMFVAVQLLMSVRNTHLEVQVLMDRDERVLRSWQRAWKAEEPDQPDMPLAKLVTRPGVDVVSIAVRLTSTADDGRTVHHHGGEGTAPRPLPGSARPPCSAWLFWLQDVPQSELRQFSLHLHEASSENAAAMLGPEICDAFRIQEYSGTCFMYQLGFTPSNQPRNTPTMKSGQFARSATSGGVFTARSMRTITELTRSVGAIYVHQRGNEVGTGICVGTQKSKFVMTCHHVYVKGKEALANGELLVSFEDCIVGNAATSFVLTGCVAECEELDYAVLTVRETNDMPEPIPCCPSTFDSLVQQAQGVSTAAGLYLTIVGYCDAVRTVDVAADWLSPTRKHIDLVKKAVADKWPQFRQHLHEYDDLAKSATCTLFYNVARHRHGSSGSAVLFSAADSVKLVALHRCGLPEFYYKNAEAQRLLPIRYTLEAGTRMSAIYEHLSRTTSDVCQRVFS